MFLAGQPRLVGVHVLGVIDGVEVQHLGHPQRSWPCQLQQGEHERLVSALPQEAARCQRVMQQLWPLRDALPQLKLDSFEV